MGYEEVVEIILLICCVTIFAGSILLSWKTRFVQIRFLPRLIRMLGRSLWHKPVSQSDKTIAPYKALFAAMSTTLGLSTLVAPVIAISLGGPGAILGFVVTSFFGSAATYVEVQLTLHHRRKGKNGIIGGPMPYIQNILSPFFAKAYAFCCLILMVVWSAAQSNQLAAILDSPMLGAFRIPTYVSGVAIAIIICFVLIGGIRRVATIASWFVPLLFVLYVGANLWIVSCNLDRLGSVLMLMVRSMISPYAMTTGALVGGLFSGLRWGIFKGIQANEAGIGTQTFPHSMVETDPAIDQEILAMVSTYTAGFVAFLSGVVALLTNTWQDPELSLGMSMVAASFQQYFAEIGIFLLVFSVLLVAVGTILGNSYNGGKCFEYVTDMRYRTVYFVGTALMLFVGAVVDAKLLWSRIDIVLACMALIHTTVLLRHLFRSSVVAQKIDSRSC